MSVNTMRILALGVIVVIGAAGCSNAQESEGEVVGIVTEVTGGLTNVEAFVVLDGEGNSHKFVPLASMTVMGAPMPHLRDHVISGEAVKVVFVMGPDGELIAHDVVHAGDTHPEHSG